MQIIEKNGKFERFCGRREYLKLKDFGNVTESGVVFYDELSGPDGAWFCLILTPSTTPEDVESAKRQLKRDRDVTGIGIAYLKEDLVED